MEKLSDYFKKFTQKTQSKAVINPHRHWTILLWIFAGVSVGLIVFSLYLFIQIKNDQVFQVSLSPSTSSNVLKEDLLTNVMKYFEQKEMRQTELENNPPVYTDPSL